MNNINGLRDRLFDLLDGVKSGSVDLDTAKTAVQVADRIIDTARVENEFLRVTEAPRGTGFIEAGRQHHEPVPKLERGMAGVAAQLQAIR
jgi:hypothetical protein